MLKCVMEQERVKHYLASQIFRGARSAEGAQLYFVHDVLTGQEGYEKREDMATGYMKMVRPAIEPALAMEIVRNRSWEL